MAWNIVHWLELSAQIFGQEGFSDRIKMQPIFGSDKPMTFIGVNHIGDRLISLFHGVDQLLALRWLDPRIVGTLGNQSGFLDLACSR